MHVTNALHVTDAVYANKTASGGVFVTYPAATTTSATVSIRTNVINESTSSKSAMVISRLLDSGGTQVGMATASSTIAAGADFDFVQSIVVANPKLWHPNSPSLYTLQTTVQDGATAVDTVSTRVGIRTIGFTHDGGMTINGTRYKALGVNLLEETYGLGNAISDQSYYYDVKRIRDAGLTFIRTSHYPHAPAFYDACDALGVVVMDAQTGWQFFSAAAAFVQQQLPGAARHDPPRSQPPERGHLGGEPERVGLHRRLGADGQQHRARRVPGQPGVLGAVVVHARGHLHRRHPAQRCARRPTRGRS